MESKSRFYSIESIAEIITDKLNNGNKEGIERQKIKLGVEVLLINLCKLTVVFITSAVFNLLGETLIMLVAFSAVRRNAFGLHALNSIICTFTSIGMFVLGAHLCKLYTFNNYIVGSCFILILILLYKYAPADTESHPLLGKKRRDKLKKESVLIGMILMIIALVIKDELWKTLITVAVIFEIINILPITYKILGRSWRNYERYEKGNHN